MARQECLSESVGGQDHVIPLEHTAQMFRERRGCVLSELAPAVSIKNGPKVVASLEQSVKGPSQILILSPTQTSAASPTVGQSNLALRPAAAQPQHTPTCPVK